MQLFNKDNNGSTELVDVLGVIDNDLTFDKWSPAIPLGIRDLKAIVGSEPITNLDALYQAGTEDSTEQEAIRLAQQAVACFTWLKIIAPLDAQHGTGGRGKVLGENQHGLTALQEWKDEESIRAMAYEATDALIETMDNAAWSWWTSGSKCAIRSSLLIKDKATFDEYYVIGSHRLFVTLLPMIREVQSAHIVPIITKERLALLLSGDATMTSLLLEACQRPLALLTMKKAVERLPVEVLPDGIVQVQQQVPVHQRLRALKEARDAVASSLGDDADSYLQQLQDIIAELDTENDSVDYYLSGPSVQRKGITF